MPLPKNKANKLKGLVQIGFYIPRAVAEKLAQLHNRVNETDGMKRSKTAIICQAIVDLHAKTFAKGD